MDFNTALNWTVPIIIVIFFIGIFYVKLKQPADMFFSWIGNGIRHLFMGGTEAVSSVKVENVINYD